MLKYLRIENIAVIETAEIDFTSGFNVLTGETGAGKSIIIDSINAVLGERTSRDLIRKGCDKASVTAIFCGLDGASVQALASVGASPDDDGNVIVTRMITSSGGTVRINGQAATVGILKEIGKYLIDIHGQHDSQMLLDPENHCRYIDRMSQNTEEKAEYLKEFKAFNAIRKELDAISSDEQEKSRRAEYLSFCIKELEAAAIEPEERERLKEKLTAAENYEKTVAAINGALLRLSGNDDGDGALALVAGAAKSITGIKLDGIDPCAEGLESAGAELEAVADKLREVLSSVDTINGDKSDIAERLDTVNRLVRKYGGSEEALFKFLSDSRQELARIETGGELKERLSKDLEASKKRLIALAQVLTAEREKTAARFAADVTAVLKYLDMNNVEFSVRMDKGRYTREGCDVVAFEVGTNVGEDHKPLHKIASGGELSRIMLAIKSVLADNDDVQTMIFDEIDTGISGFAAGKVGKQLKKISSIRQVVCVTHLAQIAAFADNHIKIEKTVASGRTFTGTAALDREARIAEIARIMSGTEMTENLYKSAEELLDRSKL